MAAVHLLNRGDLTASNRVLIAGAAQKALDAYPGTASRNFDVTLADGRVVNVKGISAADPVVTDGQHFLMIKKGRGTLLLPGGMKDVVGTSASLWRRAIDGLLGRRGKNGSVVETAEATVVREVREETGFVVPKDASIEVLGSPRVNMDDIRFYDPKHDKAIVGADGKPTGEYHLAKTYGLRPGDAFIMDSIGVKM